MNRNIGIVIMVLLLGTMIFTLSRWSEVSPKKATLDETLTAPNQPTNPDLSSRDSTDDSVEEEHPHIPGAHGGFIVPIGRDSYHAEAIFEKEGAISLYMLGADESRIHEVENQDLTAYAKLAGGSEATPIELKPSPQTGDSAGNTSRFVGTLPDSLWGQPVEVTIPVLRIGTDRFRVAFSSKVETHSGAEMPARVSSQEEKDLYLTPGGIYTQADIEANGNVTASQKFAGFMAAHDMNPKTGDKVCPVTMTKANAKCSWIVAGSTYEFCCPPCVDEFVRMAKKESEKVLPPSEYIKR